MINFQLSPIFHDIASFKVAVIGDWGQSIDDPSRPGQEKLARAMGDYLEDHPDVQYIISTGDNIYPSGVSSVHSERFNSSWREVYFRPEYPVMSSLDWYIALGNHDHSKKNNELHQVSHYSFNSIGDGVMFTCRLNVLHTGGI